MGGCEELRSGERRGRAGELSAGDCEGRGSEGGFEARPAARRLVDGPSAASAAECRLAGRPPERASPDCVRVDCERLRFGRAGRPGVLELMYGLNGSCKRLALERLLTVDFDFDRGFGALSVRPEAAVVAARGEPVWPVVRAAPVEPPERAALEHALGLGSGRLVVRARVVRPWVAPPRVERAFCERDAGDLRRPPAGCGRRRAAFSASQASSAPKAYCTSQVQFSSDCEAAGSVAPAAPWVVKPSITRPASNASSAVHRRSAGVRAANTPRATSPETNPIMATTTQRSSASETKLLT